MYWWLLFSCFRIHIWPVPDVYSICMAFWFWSGEDSRSLVIELALMNISLINLYPSNTSFDILELDLPMPDRSVDKSSPFNYVVESE